MESNLSFVELFAQAKETGDRRLVVFNQLIENVKSEILPKMVEAVTQLGYKSTYVKTNGPVLPGHQGCNLFQDYEEYITFIDCENQKIGYGVAEWDGWDDFDISLGESFLFSDVDFLKIGIINFTTNLHTSLSKLIQKREEQIKKVEALLQQ